MIVDNRVLHAEFQPQDILHRDGEIDHLVSVLEPSASTTQQGVFIHGPSGAGKTCTSTFVLEQLDAEYEGITTVSINCFRDHLRRHVHHRILSEIDPMHTLNRRNTPVGDLTEAIRERVDGPTVIVLDEADQLDDFKTLRDLYEMPDVVMLLVANQPHHVFGHLDPTLDSRIGTMDRIGFEAYSSEAIVDILRARVRAGVQSGVVETDDLELIADIVAGDARQAIVLLRNALNRVAKHGQSVLSPSVIRESIPDANRDITRARVSSLSRGQRIALETLAEIGPAGLGAIHARYEERVDDAKTERTLRRWFSDKFVQYNLVISVGPDHQPKYELTEVASDVFDAGAT